jgi:hypothetical protein
VVRFRCWYIYFKSQVSCWMKFIELK